MMSFIYWLALIIAVLLAGYLCVGMFRPEKF